jgi:hypothetical protein
MPAYFPSLSDNLAQWALAQPLFYIASAGTHGRHVNVSPKGYPGETLAVLNPNLVAYLDYTGSGSETISHIYENGRATLMFCSFGQNPRILRLFCKGRVVEADENKEEFDSWVVKMEKEDSMTKGVRAVILLDIWKVQTSCGYGVPQVPKAATALEQDGFINMDIRRTLQGWNASQIDKNQMAEYQVKNNSRSLDNLPGLRSARRKKGEWMVIGDLIARLQQREELFSGMIIGILFYWAVVHLKSFLAQ